MDFSLSEKQMAELAAIGETDFDRGIGLGVSRALDLNLQRSRSKLWCLDICSGAPYFAWVASKYDCDFIMVDGDKRTCDVARALGVLSAQHSVTWDDPLPYLPHRFDLVTMIGVNLGSAIRRPDDYGVIVRAAFRLLNPGGRVVVMPPDGYLDNVWHRIAWWQRFYSGEAKIEKPQNRVIIQAR